MCRKPRWLVRLLFVGGVFSQLDAASTFAGESPFPLPSVPRPVLSPAPLIDIPVPPAGYPAPVIAPLIGKLTTTTTRQAVEGQKVIEPEKKYAFQPQGQALDLKQCLDIAMARQPAIKAAQYSLGASTRGYLALWNLPRTAELLSPDLPIRRQQAQKGIAVGSADVIKAQYDATYDVSRMYYTFVYARQQEQTATGVIDEMELFYDVAKKVLEAGGAPNKKLDQFTLYALEDLIAKIRRLRDKAVLGQKQSLFALKEAMGIEHTFEFIPKDTELPLMAGDVTQEQVIDLATSRRAELCQASIAVDVFRLEICAQSKIRLHNVVSTFAQGTDLHSRVLPHPVRNGEYRPGAVPPEMPAVLVGKKEDRVARATELSYRQEAVYEKALGLIRLEAINSFLHWQSSAERVKEAKKRFDRSRKLVEEARAAAATKQDPELLVRNEALAGEAQAEYVEAVFKHVEALIHMEKVTAGGVTPAFPGK